MTRPRRLLNLGLLLLLIVLGLLAYFEPGHSPPPAAQPLLALPASAIEHIAIERRGKTSIQLEKNQGRWTLRAPFQATADEQHLGTLLRLARTPSLKRIPLADQPLAHFGLEEPEITLHINDQRLEFGAKTALDNRRYLRQGEWVHIIEDVAYYYLLGPAAGFASKALLPEHPMPVELELPDGLHLLWKGGTWQEQSGAPLPAPDRLNALIDNWRYAQALALTPVQTLPQNAPVIRLLPKGGEPIRWLIAQREPELVLLRPDLGLAYHFAAEAAQQLLAPPPAKPQSP